LDLIKQAMLKNLSTAKGFLIDGYPREVEQGVDFEEQVNLPFKNNSHRSQRYIF
jgi:adenylate kinase